MNKADDQYKFVKDDMNAKRQQFKDLVALIPDFPNGLVVMA